MNNHTTTTDSAAETQAAPINLRAKALELEQLWIERERDDWPEYSGTPNSRASMATRQCRLELQAYLGLLPRAVAAPATPAQEQRFKELCKQVGPGEESEYRDLAALIDNQGLVPAVTPQVAEAARPKVGERVKSIDWAYAGSQDAQAWQFPEGCWVVSVGKHGKPLRGEYASTDCAKALAAADSIDLPFSPYSARLGKDIWPAPVTAPPMPFQSSAAAPICSWEAGRGLPLEPERYYALSLTGAEIARIRGMLAT